MDAIAIACVNRSIVNYLNNAAANPTEREDLRRAVCIPERNGQTKRQLRSPWHCFARDAENALRQIVVSFKQNLRVATKATNSYECFDTASGKKSENTRATVNTTPFENRYTKIPSTAKSS